MKMKSFILIVLILLLISPVFGAFIYDSPNVTAYYPTGSHFELHQTLNTTLLNSIGKSWYVVQVDKDVPIAQLCSTYLTGNYSSVSVDATGFWTTGQIEIVDYLSDMMYYLCNLHDYGSYWVMEPSIGWYAWNGTPPITVDFDYFQQSNPKMVKFNDASTGFSPIYYYWDFGDGSTVVISNDSSLYHIYENYGTYDIKHAATDFGGASGWGNKTININPSSNYGYTLNLLPSTINYGNSTVVNLTSNHGMNDVNTVNYYIEGAPALEPNTLFSSFTKVGGAWYRTNVTGTAYTATTANPFNFSYIPETSGTKTISAWVYNMTGNYPSQYLQLLAKPSAILTVNYPAITPLVNMYLFAYDAYTGAHLTNYTLTLTDYTMGGLSRTWNNVGYQKNIVMSAYDEANLTASKEGYGDGFMRFTVPNRTGNLNDPNNPPSFDQFIGVALTPSSIGGGTNFTLVITAKDSLTKSPIPSFKCSIPQLGLNSYSDYSGSQVIMLVPYDVTFTITVSATGYTPQTQYLGSFHPATLKKVDIELVKIIPTITPTPTATPITTYTTRPTALPTTGGIILNDTFCQEPSDPISAIYYVSCSWGLKQSNFNIVLAGIIMMFCAAILGVLSQHALGFLTGTFIGFMICIGLGLIPFWVLLGLIGLGIFVGIIIIVGKG